MKRLFSSGSALLVVALFGLSMFVSGCGASPEAKAKEFAEKMCGCMEKKDEKCAEETMKQAEEYMKGLKSDEDKKKFDEAGEKIVTECMKKMDGGK